jgi:NAD(P)-dependent dehydrogenase (short-subunit alcohol dehydrogenase family)
MKDVEGRVAFITGGGSGMGLGMARAFTVAGMKVVIADLRQDHLDHAMELLTRTGASVHRLKLDVADRAAMAVAADETVRVFGKVHVLVNNAAVGLIGPMIDARYDDWDWMLGVNIGGVVNGLMEFLPKIRGHGEPGHVVCTSPMAGLFAHGGGGAGIYNTTKYAVVGLMESLHEELAPLGIGVSVFCPGLVNTNIHEFERLRPARYANTGYAVHADTAAAREEFMKTQILPAGMDPLEVGERVLRGIRNNDLYILTHPEYEQGVRDRFEAILASFPRGEPLPPPERVAAEKRVLRSQVFISERDRLQGCRMEAGAVADAVE